MTETWENKFGQLRWYYARQVREIYQVLPPWISYPRVALKSTEWGSAKFYLE